MAPAASCFDQVNPYLGPLATPVVETKSLAREAMAQTQAKLDAAKGGQQSASTDAERQEWDRKVAAYERFMHMRRVSVAIEDAEKTGIRPASLDEDCKGESWSS